jgi:hypothetical protein
MARGLWLEGEGTHNEVEVRSKKDLNKGDASEAKFTVCHENCAF